MRLQVDVPDSEKLKSNIQSTVETEPQYYFFRTKIEMKKESVLKCYKILEWGGGIVLSGDVAVAKIDLVDNLFTASALTENIFPAIPRHEYIFIFKLFLQQCFINY